MLQSIAFSDIFLRFISPQRERIFSKFQQFWVSHDHSYILSVR